MSESCGQICGSRGTDAHSKNYSLLLSGDQVRFAPVYDIASVLAYDIPLPKLSMAMKFGGSYLLTKPGPEMWLKVSREFGLAPSAVLQRAKLLMDRLPDSFADAARDSAVQAIGSSLPARLTDAVSARVATLRSTVN